MSLLENIVAKSRKINFDMSKSLNENIYAVRDDNPDNRLPVVTRKSSWETLSGADSIYMTKTYQFDIYKHLIYFTTSVLEHASKIRHHPIILIDEDVVEVRLFTKDLNDVTESDIELSKFIDEIYQEINYILEF